MLNVIQRFGKQLSCHLQGEYVGWAYFGSLNLQERPTNILSLEMATAVFAGLWIT
jgi:hypothetical protein